MRNAKKINRYILVCEMLKRTLEYLNRCWAISYIIQHNKTHPDDPLILHGTYERTIFCYSEELGYVVSFKIRVIRIRSKKQNKTFSFQGGLLVRRCKYAWLFTLLAKIVKREKGTSFEMACVHMDLPVKTARRYLKRLREFLASQCCLHMLAKEQTPEEFAKEFIKKLWHKANNPFCSEIKVIAYIDLISVLHNHDFW